MKRSASGVCICPRASHHVGTYCLLLDRMSRPGNGSRGIVAAKGKSFNFLTMRSISRHSNKKDIRLAGIARSRDGRRNKILFEAQRWPSCCESTYTPCTVLFG